jgi:hypothetical protein
MLLYEHEGYFRLVARFYGPKALLIDGSYPNATASCKGITPNQIQIIRSAMTKLTSNKIAKIYGPEEKVLAGHWQYPPVQKA